jgi:acetyltransferase-like isoleucine patch superfamily enzyme
VAPLVYPYYLAKKLVRPLIWSLNNVFVAPGSEISLSARIGRYSRLNAPSFIGPCSIGKFVACGGRLIVRSSNHFTCYANMQDWAQKHIIKSPTRVAGKIKGNVEIKSASWIGDSVIIVPGGSIGFGAVIGAGSVVTKPIPDFAVAVGNPAKVIKYRIPEHCIEFLLRIRWWDWSLKKIRNNKHFFEIDFTTVDLETLKHIQSSLR